MSVTPAANTNPRRCCVPSLANLQQLQGSMRRSENRTKATKGSLEGMVKLDGGPFLMGSEDGEALEEDGERPVLRVTLSPFHISRTAVSNEQFAEFTARTGYRTEAEHLGWSFVFRGHVAEPERYTAAPIVPWWLRIDGAAWNCPEGPGSSVADRMAHPAVHISWNDARAYCDWAGYRLPWEAEWEYASRGGLEQKRYPWGDELMPDGHHRCNIWQGEFPAFDRAEDGFAGAAPVRAFEPNAYGMFNTVGNVWEWCGDIFDPEWRASGTRLNPTGAEAGNRRVMKGGSFLCHASYCFRYRNAARTGNAPDIGSSNMGFRAVRDL